MPALVRRPPSGLPVAVGVVATVLLLAQVPFLRNRLFYAWDDSAAQFLPMWHHLGGRLTSGRWPLLEVDNWMGGNIAAEALFGIWNPVNLANYVLVSRFDDLALAGLVVKSEFLALLALGTYLLCRGYGAGRGPAAVVAIALPFCGFTLYYDASSWASGLMAFTWVVLTWWAAKRLDAGGSPLWPFLFGALAVTSGNPYGVLGVCVVLFALVVEAWLRRDRTVLVRLLVVGVLVGLLVPLVYLPLLGTSAVTIRAGQGFASNGLLMPRLSDLLHLSVPSHLPLIRTFSDPLRLTVPGVYFAWFVVPLLPWLRWDLLRGRWRGLVGVFAVGLVYLLLALGPSNAWMFRFPLRHVQVLFLAVGVLFAVLLTAGLRVDHLRRRVLVTAGVLVLSAYLTFAAGTWQWQRHLVSLGLLAAGTALVVFRARAGRGVSVVLVLGVAATLSLQTSWFPANRDVADHVFPRSVAALRAAAHGGGTTFPVGSVDPGNVGLVAGTASVGSYTGMSLRAFADATCMDFAGSTCPDSLRRIFTPTDVDGRTPADLMGLETIVVQRGVLPEVTAPAGWALTDRTDTRLVLRRIGPVEWPEGRLTHATVDVDRDVSPDDRHEHVRFTKARGETGTLVFARLAWPGYRAELDGVHLRTSQGPAGLLVVHVPADVEAGEVHLTWVPPGLPVGIALAAASLLSAFAHAAFTHRRRRRPLDFVPRQRRNPRHAAMSNAGSPS
ncbi:hypothetical protein [Saccharothrix stipae]